jgi:hypothetical protein
MSDPTPYESLMMEKYLKESIIGRPPPSLFVLLY